MSNRFKRPPKSDVDPRYELNNLLRRFGPLGFMVIDFETRSMINLLDVGPMVYAQHPSTSVLCLSFKMIHPDKGILPTRLWTPDKGIPKAIEFMMIHCLPLYAHNAWFERNIWKHIMKGHYGWPDIFFEQWHCIAAQANAAAMPRKLFDLCKVLGLDSKKDAEGHSLMMKMCKPRKPKQADRVKYLEGFFGEDVYKKKELSAMTKDDSLFEDLPTLWHETPAQLKRLGKYCVKDTDAEFEAMVTLPDMIPREVKVWQLDQRINLRGVPCDKVGIKAALSCLGKMARESKNEIDSITQGLVQTPDQRDKLKEYCHVMGVNIPNVQAETVEAYLKKDIPIEVRRVLEIRQLMAKASVKKYMAMWTRLKHGHSRLYGLLIYAGASKTARWTSGGVQVQNMARGKIKDEVIIEFCLDCIRRGDVETLSELYDVVTDVFSSLTRSMICAPDDKVLMCADFSSIEARVAFWLSGQKDALEIFRAVDRDKANNPDIYQDNAASIYAKDVWDVTADERETGKRSILGFQYGMAEKTFQKNCWKNYGVHIELDFCEFLKKAYREKYKKVVALWSRYDKTVKRVIRDRSRIRVNQIVFECKGDFLTVLLPTGRRLHYYKPTVETKKVKGETWLSTQIRFWGRDSQTKQWKKLYMYGAKVFQHIVQALGREFIALAMLRVDEKYPIILTVHDEILVEVLKALVENGELSLKDFCEQMSIKPDWAGDCPIKAAGWIGKRYRK